MFAWTIHFTQRLAKDQNFKIHGHYPIHTRGKVFKFSPHMDGSNATLLRIWKGAKQPSLRTWSGNQTIAKTASLANFSKWII